MGLSVRSFPGFLALLPASLDWSDLGIFLLVYPLSSVSCAYTFFPNFNGKQAIWGYPPHTIFSFPWKLFWMLTVFSWHSIFFVFKQSLSFSIMENSPSWGLCSEPQYWLWLSLLNLQGQRPNWILDLCSFLYRLIYSYIILRQMSIHKLISGILISILI